MDPRCYMHIWCRYYRIYVIYIWYTLTGRPSSIETLLIVLSKKYTDCPLTSVSYIHPQQNMKHKKLKVLTKLGQYVLEIPVSDWWMMICSRVPECQIIYSDKKVKWAFKSVRFSTFCHFFTQIYPWDPWHSATLIYHICRAGTEHSLYRISTSRNHSPSFIEYIFCINSIEILHVI